MRPLGPFNVAYDVQVHEPSAFLQKCLMNSSMTRGDASVMPMRGIYLHGTGSRSTRGPISVSINAPAPTPTSTARATGLKAGERKLNLLFKGPPSLANARGDPP